MLQSVAMKDICGKARKMNSHNPNRLYVVAYIRPIFFSYDKGNNREGRALDLSHR